MHIPFTASPRSSLGVEWELELVDLESRQLSSGATEIIGSMSERYRAGRQGAGGDMDEAPAAGEHPTAKHELLQSTVEIITGVCQTVSEAREDLARTLEQVMAGAEERGLGVMCSGTHPITRWASQQITANPRYEKLINDTQWLGRRLAIFGVHVHVGVRSPDKAIHIVNALTAYIPHFLAISASSPYWQGEETGLASARSKVFEGLPTAGLPYLLDDWAHFEDFMATLITSQTISSIKEVWWDIRPHPTYGTVELRVADGLPTLREVTMVAALAQCLVEHLDNQMDKGYVLPRPKGWVVRENKWRAARYGLDAHVITDGHGSTQPVRAALVELVQDLSPTADRLGCRSELELVHEVLEGGASYQRQRAVAAASGGDLTAVVDSLLQEMRDDRPARLPVIDLAREPVDRPAEAVAGAVPASGPTATPAPAATAARA